MSDGVSLISLAITASASLLGTVVGGLSAYWTTKKSYEHQAGADESRQRLQLLRDASIRFLRAVSDITAGSVGLERISDQWGSNATALVAARTDDEVVAAARAIHPGLESGGGRIAILMRLLRETGVLDEEVRAGTAALSELRLIAPADVATSAQRVLYGALIEEMTEAFAPHLHRKATYAYNAAVNEFFNRVRHHMSVEDIEFDFVNEVVLRDMLDLERDLES